MLYFRVFGTYRSNYPYFTPAAGQIHQADGWCGCVRAQQDGCSCEGCGSGWHGHGTGHLVNQHSRYTSNIPETHITFIISYPMFSPWFFSASLPRVHQPLSHMSAPLRHVVESMCSRSFATVCSPLSVTWGRTFKMQLRIGLCLSHFLSSKFKCQTHFNFWARAFQTQSNALQPASHIGRLVRLKEISIPWRRSTTCFRNIWLKVRPLTSTKSGLACKQFFKNVAGPIMFAKKPG